MKRTLVVVAAVVGFATASSAATLSVVSELGGGGVQNTFTVGQTIVLRVTGDAQGGTTNGIHGELTHNGAITTTISASQSVMYANPGFQFLGDGLVVAFDQNSGSAVPSAPSSQTLTSLITMIADAAGVSQVGWGGEGLEFFNISTYYGTNVPANPVHSFTIVPEPATAALIGLGLLGLTLGGRRRS